jgi:protein SCO1/2
VLVTEPPKPVADFALTDQDGRPFDFSRLRGRPALVFFGFTHCPDVCPAALAKLKLLHARDAELARVQVVFISVDGNRDTPEAVKAYLAPLSQQFLGLTGDPELVRDVAARFAAAFFKGQPGGDAQDYEVQHSSQIYLVDAAGDLRAEFYDAPLDTMATLTRAVLKARD